MWDHGEIIADYGRFTVHWPDVFHPKRWTRPVGPVSRYLVPCSPHRASTEAFKRTDWEYTRQGVRRTDHQEHNRRNNSVTLCWP